MSEKEPAPTTQYTAWSTAVVLVAICATVVIICGLGSWVIVSIWGN